MLTNNKISTGEIETERLILKILDESSAQMVHDFLNRNKEYFKPWTPTPPEDFFTLHRQAEILKKKYKSFTEGKDAKFLIFKKEHPDRIIGEFSFSNIIKGPFCSCYLGYQMDHEENSKGYMTEALKAGVEYAFTKFMLHRVESNVIPRNKSSIRLMEKLGFENEGLSRKFFKINGVWEDHFHFVMLNDKVE